MGITAMYVLGVEARRGGILHGRLGENSLSGRTFLLKSSLSSY